MRRFGSRQADDVVVPPVTFLGERSGQPACLGRVAGDLHGAPLDDARVDAFPLGHLDDLVDGLVEGALPGHDAVAAVLPGHRVAVAGHQPGQPPTVAA